MKRMFLLVSLSLFSLAAFAQDDVSNETARSRISRAVINSCLGQFPNHPFDHVNVKPRYVFPTVSVLGRGTTLVDNVLTDEPELVVISSTVNVLGHANYQLLNPNAWYCLLSNVSVMGVTNIDLDCDAHLAQLNVSVYSKVNINRIGECAGHEHPTPDEM